MLERERKEQRNGFGCLGLYNDIVKLRQNRVVTGIATN